MSFPLALAAALLAGGCHSTTQSSQQPGSAPAPNQSAQQPASAPAPNQPAQQAMNPGAGSGPMPPAPAQNGVQQPNAPASATPAPRAPTTIPAGTHIVVSLGQTLSSKTAQAGDRFNATVVDPVRVGGVVLIRAGAPASGTVTDAKALGHFKGGAELAIRLDSVRAEGHTYQVASSTIERAEKGKGKRTAALTGGGTGFGAIVGGLAGGGRGALIGGLAGAGAGATGSALTGNKELVIPAETSLTFRLERNVSLN